MLKDQKYQQNRDKSAYGFRTFEQADQIRQLTVDGLANAKDKTTKVKVRARPGGTFDVVVFQPLSKSAEAPKEEGNLPMAGALGAGSRAKPAKRHTP